MPSQSERQPGADREAYVTELAAEIARLYAENALLREAVRDYAQHTSWRCEHRPHYYFASGVNRDQEIGCPCGLDRTLRELGLPDV